MIKFYPVIFNGLSKIIEFHSQRSYNYFCEGYNSAKDKNYFLKYFIRCRCTLVGGKYICE